MKYKKRYLKSLYQDPVKNFKEIIDVSIYFDDIDELDYGSEAVAAIESLDQITISNLLISDLPNRKKGEFENYGYQSIWWALLNSGDDSVYKNLALNMTEELKKLLKYWLNEVLETDDEPYIGINKLFNRYMK